MYIDTARIKRAGKTYVRHLLRESYREDGKVKHRTVLNLSHWTDHQIYAFKLALKHKDSVPELVNCEDVEAQAGKRIGAVIALKAIAERLGIAASLGNDTSGKLALLQVLARIIGQGSRLSAVRLAQSHALCEVLGIKKLDEDDLYDNLAWLAEQQEPD